MGFGVGVVPVDMKTQAATVQLLEWNSTLIHRKTNSTLAAEGTSGSVGFDHLEHVKACWAEQHKISGKWHEQVAKLPGRIVTDCMSLYDNIRKTVAQTQEKRVMLDVEDMRDGIEYGKDEIAWIPTSTMPMDALTKLLSGCPPLNKWLAGQKCHFYDRAKDAKFLGMVKVEECEELNYLKVVEE